MNNLNLHGSNLSEMDLIEIKKKLVKMQMIYRVFVLWNLLVEVSNGKGTRGNDFYCETYLVATVKCLS